MAHAIAIPHFPAMTPTQESADPVSADEADALDCRLMAEIAAGDMNSFRTLVERHQHAVIGTVAKMLGDPTEAEDIAQQVFLRVWKHSKRWRPEAKFTTYLFTITRNLVFNESRRRSRKPAHSIEEHESTNPLPLAGSPDAHPDSAALHSELEQAVDAAIAKLPEKQRMAVILRRQEELSYEEISQILEMSVPALKSLLFRAREALRGHLASYLD